MVQLPVGVGKSLWLADAARHALTTARPGALVLITAPRNDILTETCDRLSDLRPVLLIGRPRQRCGNLDVAWQEYERAGCGLLARSTLCRQCPVRAGCGWVRQARRLGNARLVLAAQQHLQNNPAFVDYLRTQTGAAAVVTLVDESDLLLQPFARRVGQQDLARFAEVIAAVGAGQAAFGGWAVWLQNLEPLRRAGEDDLRAGDWTLPRPPAPWVLAVQRRGRNRFGAAFRYVGYDLLQFARSDRRSRGRGVDGELTFAVAPDQGDEAAIFTGSIATGLVRHRLDPDRVGSPPFAPFAGVRFKHPGTRWFNLNDRAGTAAYFSKNSDRILDVFARLVARNIDACRRTLLVARKQFRELCREALTRKLADLGVGPVTVVTGNWGDHNLTDPRTLPLITYGVSGINRFEDFDAAYCLTGFYVAKAAVERLVNDLVAPAHHAPVELGSVGDPPRRSASIGDPALLHTVVPALAHWSLAQKEADVVVQAVGRVRPFTRPREVITFQTGALPGVTYTREFKSLGEARSFFGVLTARAAATQGRAVRARELRRAGMSTDEIAATMKVSRASVKRYLANPGPDG